MKEIWKFDLRYSEKEILDYQKYSKEILKRGFLTESKYLNEFTSEFKNYQKLKYGVTVTSGTDALLAAFKACLEPEDEIIIPSNTFVATYISAKLAGLKIKLSDVNPYDGMLDLQTLKKTITNKTKAVCIVHIGGSVSSEIFDIKKFCKDKKILLFEDAAHSVGSEFKGVSAGNFGFMGCFSFFSTKSFTLGEGGFVSCQSLKSEKKLKSVKNFGRTRNQEDWHEELGFNMKVTELQAALGLIEIARSEDRINKRRRLFSQYVEQIKNKDIEILHTERINESSCYKIIMKADTKLIRKIKTVFNENKIAMTGSVYSKQIGKHKAFKYEKEFLNSQSFIDSHFCPPLYPELEIKDINRVCKVLNDI